MKLFEAAPAIQAARVLRAAKTIDKAQCAPLLLPENATRQYESPKSFPGRGLDADGRVMTIAPAEADQHKKKVRTSRQRVTSKGLFSFLETINEAA